MIYETGSSGFGRPANTCSKTFRTRKKNMRLCYGKSIHRADSCCSWWTTYWESSKIKFGGRQFQVQPSDLVSLVKQVLDANRISAESKTTPSPCADTRRRGQAA